MLKISAHQSTPERTRIEQYNNCPENARLPIKEKSIVRQRKMVRVPYLFPVPVS